MGRASEAGNLIPVWMVTAITHDGGNLDDVKITHCTRGNAPTGYTHSLTAGHNVYYLGELLDEDNQPLAGQAGATPDATAKTDDYFNTNPGQNGNSDSTSDPNPGPSPGGGNPLTAGVSIGYVAWGGFSDPNTLASGTDSGTTTWTRPPIATGSGGPPAQTPLPAPARPPMIPQPTFSTPVARSAPQPINPSASPQPSPIAPAPFENTPTLPAKPGSPFELGASKKGSPQPITDQPPMTGGAGKSGPPPQPTKNVPEKGPVPVAPSVPGISGGPRPGDDWTDWSPYFQTVGKAVAHARDDFFHDYPAAIDFNYVNKFRFNLTSDGQLDGPVTPEHEVFDAWDTAAADAITKRIQTEVSGKLKFPAGNYAVQPAGPFDETIRAAKGTANHLGSRSQTPYWVPNNPPPKP